MYYLLLPYLAAPTHYIQMLKANGMSTVFHYVPLHSAPAGKAFTKTHGTMTQTESLSKRLGQRPLWVQLDAHIERVIAALRNALTNGEGQ